MDRYRLIASIVVLFIYLLALYPWQTVLVSIFIVVCYLILKNLNSDNTISKSKSLRRRTALQEAKIYIAPYTDIWRNLRLSNKYCTLRLGMDGQTITAKEKIGQCRSLRVIKSKVHAIDDLWDMLCVSFDHNTSFDALIEQFETFMTEIKVEGGTYTVEERKHRYSTENRSRVNDKEVNVDMLSSMKNEERKEKLDVNNASEIELTALPGVSIVMAKKLIKKREEVGGFKSVNDVCLFLHLKPHMQEQLEKLICVNKMKGSVNIKRYEERKLDL